MSAFAEFWMKIGDRIKISVPPSERSIAVRRTLAARAFERWRLGLLEVETDTVP